MDRETLEEIKRHFGIVAEEVRGDVRLVADGLQLLRDEFVGHRQEFVGLRQEFVGHRDEFVGLRQEFVRHRQEFLDFRSEVAREFEETRSLIRLSYGELDRRVRDLEGEVAGLRVRLEKVESRLAG